MPPRPWPTAGSWSDGWDWSKVNVNGGAIALGHPIGCSGTRVLVTLIYALKDRGLKRGMATLCLGGGEAVALAVEIEEADFNPPAVLAYPAETCGRDRSSLMTEPSSRPGCGEWLLLGGLALWLAGVPLVVSRRGVGADRIHPH